MYWSCLDYNWLGFFFFFNDTATTEIYTLSLHDALPISIGVALQEAGLDPRQTGRELLVMHGELFGLSPSQAKERAQELLALVELESAADRVIKGYSGGMQRRLDLAAALVHEPDVLFLDEPTTGLDPASRLTVW